MRKLQKIEVGVIVFSCPREGGGSCFLGCIKGGGWVGLHVFTVNTGLSSLSENKSELSYNGLLIKPFCDGAISAI